MVKEVALVLLACLSHQGGYSVRVMLPQDALRALLH